MLQKKSKATSGIYKQYTTHLDFTAQSHYKHVQDQHGIYTAISTLECRTESNVSPENR